MNSIAKIVSGASLIALLIGGMTGVWWLEHQGAKDQATKDAPIVAKAQAQAAQAGLDAKAQIANVGLVQAETDIQEKVHAGQNAIHRDAQAAALAQPQAAPDLVPADIDADWRAAIGRLRRPAAGDPGTVGDVLTGPGSP